MYWALLKQGLARRRRSLWHGAVMRSGMLTILIICVVITVLAVGWREHRLGQFAQLKKGFNPPPRYAVALRPGGQDVVRLERSPLVGESGAEFLSATLLPGRGMNVLQISAYLPGKGEVNLLASPPLDEATKRMSGTGADSTGAESLAVGGAIEAPWAGRISGTPTPDGQSLLTMWHGMRLTLPADARNSSGSGAAMATGGLLLKQPSSTVNTNVMPDGGQVQATYEVDDFDGHWPSSTEITTLVGLSGRSIEMKIVARNTGTTAEPMGIGWHPRFAILNGHRGQILLRLPQADRVEVKDRQTGETLSGRFMPVAGTEYDFTGPSGAKLGQLDLDDSFVHLHRGLMESGPVAEMRDPENGYGLRITAMTPTIKAFHVHAPLDQPIVSIDPQFNYDDPFGREWPKEEDTGMVILQPGQSAQWKIRLEIFSLDSDHRERL